MKGNSISNVMGGFLSTHTKEEPMKTRGGLELEQDLGTVQLQTYNRQSMNSTYMTFSDVGQTVVDGIPDNEHISLQIVLGLWVRLGIIVPILNGGGYTPSRLAYEEMRGKYGLEQFGVYRRKGQSYGFNVEPDGIGELNSKVLEFTLDELAKLDKKLKLAMQEADAIYSYIKTRDQLVHYEAHSMRDIIFSQLKNKLVRDLLASSRTRAEDQYDMTEPTL